MLLFPTMKCLISLIKNKVSILVLLGFLFFQTNLFAQDCFNCNGDKTTCGQLGCDFECFDCEGPSIPVDNGVLILLASGVLAFVFFVGRKKQQVDLSQNS